MFEKAVILAPDWEGLDPTFLGGFPGKFSVTEGAKWSYPVSLLANALVFYDEVRLVGSDEDFAELMVCVGPENLLNLCESGRLKFTRIDGIGFFTVDVENPDELTLGRFSPMKGHEIHLARGGTRTFAQDQRYALELVMQRHLRGAGISGILLDKVLSSLWENTQNFNEEEQLTGAYSTDSIALDLLGRGGASQKIIRDWFKSAAPGAPVPRDPSLYLAPSPGERGFIFDLGFDPRQVVSGDYTDAAFCGAILNYTMGLVRDVVVSSLCDGDIATPGSQGGLLDQFASNRAKRSIFNREIPDFLELNFSDSDAVGRAIAEGRRDFSDLQNLLERKDSFARWLRGTPASSELAIEYTKYLKSKTWLESERGKALRFVMFTGAGLLADQVTQSGLGTATGIALGAFDTFLLERISGGWKPSRFVDQHMEDFVSLA